MVYPIQLKYLDKNDVELFSPVKFPVDVYVLGVWPLVRGHDVNPEMKPLISSREWKWAPMHSGSLPAQPGTWAAFLVVSAWPRRPAFCRQFIIDKSSKQHLVQVFVFLGSIAYALGYWLCSLEAGTCEILVPLWILERTGESSSGESGMAQCKEGHSQPSLST